MGFRFRRRIKIFPGLYLNVSTKGTSMSVGVPGAMLNLGGRGGAKATVGIPGTGVSFQHGLSGGHPVKKTTPTKFHETNFPNDDYPVTDVSMTPVVSADIDTIGEMGMSELVDMINESESTRRTLLSDILLKTDEISRLGNKIKFLRLPVVRSIFKRQLENNLQKKGVAENILLKVKEDLDNCGVYFDWAGDEGILSRYREVSQKFRFVSSSEKIWDITSFRETDKFRERTQADTTVSRTIVIFSTGRPDCLPVTKNDEFKKVPHLGNKNGGDIYIFPGFILMVSDNSFAAIPLSELQVKYSTVKFAETEGVPVDSETQGNTWRYANKNGGPDKRFNDNYPIPWAVYGNIEIRFRSVVHEEYMISNHKAAYNFAESLNSLIIFAKENSSNTTME